MPRGVGLTRDRVVALAGEVVDRDGVLSLGAVAAEAGVKTPSLYKHVDGLPGLTQALVADTYRALATAVASASADHPEEAVVTIAHAWRAYARAHPGRYALTARTHLAGDAEVQEVGAALLANVLDRIKGLGLDDTDAVHAARAFRAMVHGFVLLEAAEGFGLDVEVDASFEAAVRALVRGCTTPTRP